MLTGAIVDSESGIRKAGCTVSCSQRHRMQTLRFSTRATNLTIVALLIPAALSGFGAFLAGSEGGRWILWVHAAVGFSLALLFVWKRRIITGSLQRHGVGVWALPSLFLLLLLITSLLSGVLWATTGLPDLAGVSGVTLHAAFSAALVLLVLPHAKAGWPRRGPSMLADRRALLRTGLLLGAGAILWRGSEAASTLAGLSGAGRRFTGSRAAASTPGEDFPPNSWLFDNPEPIRHALWRLDLSGAVAAPQQLAIDDLVAAQTWSVAIDCTGGWYSMQAWQGTPLSTLLLTAIPAHGARSIVVRSVTGYARRFPLASAERILLATKVQGAALSHEHGSPARLVVPGRRGYDWVKWVTSIEVSPLPAWLQWPLPIF
jgi:hypothetical protein